MTDMIIVCLLRLAPVNNEAKPDAPVVLRVEGTSVHLEWETPEDSAGRAIIDYTIKYGVPDCDSEEYNTLSVGQRTTAYTFNGVLRPQTSYIFAVAAKTDAGEGPFSEFSEVVQTNAGS